MNKTFKDQYLAVRKNRTASLIQARNNLETWSLVLNPAFGTMQVVVMIILFKFIIAYYSWGGEGRAEERKGKSYIDYIYLAGKSSARVQGFFHAVAQNLPTCTR